MKDKGRLDIRIKHDHAGGLTLILENVDRDRYEELLEDIKKLLKRGAFVTPGHFDPIYHMEEEKNDE